MTTESNNKDNFEKFFQKLFESKVTAEEWNSPGDKVWSNIEKSLTKNKKRNPLVIPLLFVFGSLLVFSALLFNYQKDINDLRMSLAACQNDKVLSSLNVESNTEPKSDQGYQAQPFTKNSETVNHPTPITIGKGYSHLHHSKANDKAYSSGSATSNTTASSTSINIVKKDSSNLQSLVTNAAKDTNIDPITPGDSMGSHQELLESMIINNVSSTKILEIPQTDIENSIDTNLNFKPLSDVQVHNATTNKKMKTFLGLNIGNYIGQSIKNGEPTHSLVELITEEKLNYSMAMGITAKFDLNDKWNIAIHPRVSRRNFTTTYILQIPYSRNTERIVSSNEYENDFTHNLPTSMGSVNTHLVVTRNINHDVHDNEPLVMDFNTTLSSLIVSLPLQLDYFPMGKNKGWYGSLGIQADVDLQNKLQTTRLNSLHQIIKEKEMLQIRDAEGYKNWQLYISPGIGYEKSISKNWILSFQANYIQGLTSIYREENFTHKIGGASALVSILRSL